MVWGIPQAMICPPVNSMATSINLTYQIIAEQNPPQMTRFNGILQKAPESPKFEPQRFSTQG